MWLFLALVIPVVGFIHWPALLRGLDALVGLALRTVYDEPDFYDGYYD